MGDYPCQRCGNCCSALHLNPLYRELDRGDGVCRHHDQETKLCTIYKNRPILCNVDAGYAFFATDMTKDEYYRRNKLACEQLRNSLTGKYRNLAATV